MKKRYLVAIILIVLLYGFARLYYFLTDDFRMGNITFDHAHEYTSFTPHLTDSDKNEVRAILNQKFYYLGRGAQAYAFGSEDGKYILKFFKFKYLRPNPWLQWLPPLQIFQVYKDRDALYKKMKLKEVFKGYEIGLKQDQEHTKILYLHLKPTFGEYSKVHLVDKMGMERLIDLDKCIFLIQMKGETWSNRMRRFLDAHQIDEAIASIEKIVAMFLSEFQEGIYDHDHFVLLNTGFIGDEPFHLDAGELDYDERVKDKNVYRYELEQILYHIYNWIRVKYPTDRAIFKVSIERIYKNATGLDLDFDTIDPKIYKKNRKDLVLDDHKELPLPLALPEQLPAL